MIPSINDFTSYWRFDQFNQPTQYIGILFGENILVYNNQVINLTKLLNDNRRIHNAILNKKKLYVLLDNNNLYIIETTNFGIYKLVCGDVKNICAYVNKIYILQNNGDVLNNNLVLTHKNVSVVSNIPRSCTDYTHIYGCYTNNMGFEFATIPNPSVPLNTNKIVDMCIVCVCTIILCNDNTASMYKYCGNKIKTFGEKIKNVNCISSVSRDTIGIIYGDYNVVVYKVKCWELYTTDDSMFDGSMSHKSISIQNSPYCAKFNAQTIPYYPKYFMDRFIAFVMSVKYGYNIKLPKYLYFMIANYLR